MTEITFDEAYERFPEMVKRADDGERIVIMLHGKRAVALVPVADADTVERREDRIDRRAVRRARKDIEKHGTIPWEKVKADLGLE